MWTMNADRVRALLESDMLIAGANELVQIKVGKLVPPK